MKKAISVCLAALILAVSLQPTAFAAQMQPQTAFLHTEGEQIVRESGEPIVLRGTNFGGWGILEDWFCPFTEPSGLENIYQTLVSRFGTDATHALFQNYRRNWTTEIDYQNVADMGMNVIRLPIWYRNLQRDDDGTWYRDEAGKIDFSELDTVVSLCRKYGLYLILDLHGLPGYQNDYDHCGKSKSMSLFDDTPQGARYREVTLDLWTQLAAHYADEPVIAMYDLMNEPLGTNITRDKSLKQNFWDFSDALYRAIRAVDSRHIITMEAIWDPSAMAAPSVYGWENVVYQEHWYDVSNPSYLHKANEIRAAKYGVPFYIGEFYPRVISSFDYILSLLNHRGLNWTTWTYKGAGPGADNSPWFLYGASGLETIDAENDSYETLMHKWGEVLRTDGGAFRRTAFADYLQHFTDGTVDRTALYSFGLVCSVGTREQRRALTQDKLHAIYTTILDWIRKFRTGDLL